ncbi:MAG TPA: B-box zinc finger protein [Bryobacteraceae bacterium]|nr:B-box zinc finger protein [Bryobacteraceae bacterium]
MNCFNHPETPAVAYCRACGKALCNDCKRTAQGTVFCDEHAPAAAIEGAIRQAVVDRMAQQAAAAVNPPKAGENTATGDVSPGLACLLGFIPGVGAIYNGQYAKGLVHAIVFGLLVSITSSGTAGDLEPLFGILIGVWVMYMALEAYHTARKRRAGEPVDEFSSILDVHGRRGGFPVGAITLIALGVLLLLSTTDVIQLRYLLRYWPILLILAGAYMLYVRIAGDGPVGQEVRHERQ